MKVSLKVNRNIFKILIIPLKQIVVYPGEFNSNEITYNRYSLTFADENFQRMFNIYEKKYSYFRKRINLLIFILGISDIITNSVFLIDDKISNSNIVFGIVLFLLFFFEIICIFEMNQYAYLADGVVITYN